MGAGAGEAAAERPCLEVLLGLPARGIARRSEAHLSQALEVRGGGLRLAHMRRREEAAGVGQRGAGARLNQALEARPGPGVCTGPVYV